MTDAQTEAQRALIAALHALSNPPKDEQGQYGRYTSLPKLLEHVKPVLASHGFALVQPAVGGDDAHVGVQTQLLHTSGLVWDGGTLLLPTPADAQKAGSAITYARRYALCALLGIAGDDDDDGVAATDRSGRTGQRVQERGGDAPPPVGEGTPATAPTPGPTLPIDQSTSVDWRAVAQKLTRLLRTNVTQADAKLKVREVLRARDVRVEGGRLIDRPSDVTVDLAWYAVDEVENGLPKERGKA